MLRPPRPVFARREYHLVAGVGRAYRHDDAARVAAAATVAGAIEIGRHPKVVQVTLRAPLERLETKGLPPYVRDQYGIG